MTSGASRWRSTTRVPASDSNTRSRNSAVPSSVEPASRNFTFAQTSRASWRRLIMPLRYAARANWNALEPSISVLSRSKKAAAFPPPPPSTVIALSPVDLDDHGVALAAARADGGHAEPSAATAQLVRERHQHARAARPNRVPEGDRAAVDVHLHGGLGLLRLDGDGHDLLGQPALVCGLHRQLVAAQGELVEVRARELELLAHLGGLRDHALARERVGEAVVHHGVDRLGVAHS